MSKMYIEYVYIIIYIWQLFPGTWKRYRIILCGARLLPSHYRTSMLGTQCRAIKAQWFLTVYGTDDDAGCGW